MSLRLALTAPMPERGEDIGILSANWWKELERLGLSRELLHRAAVCLLEGESNTALYGRNGSASLTVDEDTLELTFRDEGPGIPDPEEAVTPGFTTADASCRALGYGGGMGLANLRRFSDELSLTSGAEGTVLRVRISL